MELLFTLLASILLSLAFQRVFSFIFVKLSHYEINEKFIKHKFLIFSNFQILLENIIFLRYSTEAESELEKGLIFTGKILFRDDYLVILHKRGSKVFKTILYSDDLYFIKNTLTFHSSSKV
jgi:hypothetical protein